MVAFALPTSSVDYQLLPEHKEIVFVVFDVGPCQRLSAEGVADITDDLLPSIEN